MATMKTKSVGFNIEDQSEKDLLAWSDAKKNFSGYVKELIAADKKKRSISTQPIEKNVPLTSNKPLQQQPRL
jgi:hypothetical protein